MKIKKIFINELSDNAPVNNFFLIETPSLNKTKTENLYISCTLSDRTGRIACKIWGRRDNAEIEKVYQIISANPGTVFFVSGKVQAYNGELGINVNDGITELAKPADQRDFSPDDFTYSPVDTVRIKSEIERLVKSIEDEGLRNITEGVLKRADGFYDKPAAVTKHHEYAGGLAEHSLETAKTALNIMEAYPHIPLRRDLILAGALLHDVGKCTSFEKTGLSYSTAPDNNLLSHIIPGAMILEHYSAYTDEDTFRDLVHIIVSHHGEHGDVQPQIQEALIVHFADNISASLREMTDDIAPLLPGTTAKGRKIGTNVYKSKKYQDVTQTQTNAVPDSEKSGSHSGSKSGRDKNQSTLRI